MVAGAPTCLTLVVSPGHVLFLRFQTCLQTSWMVVVSTPSIWLISIPSLISFHCFWALGVSAVLKGSGEWPPRLCILSQVISCSGGLEQHQLSLELVCQVLALSPFQHWKEEQEAETEQIFNPLLLFSSQSSSPLSISSLSQVENVNVKPNAYEWQKQVLGWVDGLNSEKGELKFGYTQYWRLQSARLEYGQN